jgi:hypothetical protein
MDFEFRRTHVDAGDGELGRHRHARFSLMSHVSADLLLLRMKAIRTALAGLQDYFPPLLLKVPVGNEWRMRLEGIYRHRWTTG